VLSSFYICTHVLPLPPPSHPSAFSPRMKIRAPNDFSDPEKPLCFFFVVLSPFFFVFPRSPFFNGVWRVLGRSFFLLWAFYCPFLYSPFVLSLHFSTWRKGIVLLLEVWPFRPLGSWFHFRPVPGSSPHNLGEPFFFRRSPVCQVICFFFF